GLCVFAVAIFACLLRPAPVQAQQSGSQLVKLRIHVTAGDQNKPVSNASVYVKYPEHKNGNLSELDFKTNEDGSVKVPDLPKGRMLIQVVAPGWKTFGKYFDFDKDEEDVAIHLENRPRWY